MANLLRERSLLALIGDEVIILKIKIFNWEFKNYW